MLRQGPLVLVQTVEDNVASLIVSLSQLVLKNVDHTVRLLFTLFNALL